MNTLITGLIICGVAIIFVNVILFGFIGISLKSISLGTLLGIQAVFALFFLFLFIVTKRKE